MNQIAIAFGWSNVELTAVLVAIIAATVSIIGALINLFIARRSTYVNSVTAERARWIEKLRNNIAKYSELLRSLHNENIWNQNYFGTPERRKILKEINGLISLIKLQLNPFGKIDQNIIVLVEQIPFLAERSSSFDFLIADRLLIAHAQWLLKAEWEKVKSESTSVIGLTGWIRHTRHLWRYRQFCRVDGVIEQLMPDATIQG